ncbi:MAG TPA: hypothetical protein VHG92_07970 [Afifellaceae bacterium]|nr:hypothetical protein [Afifellaceae bacterium]
MVRALALLGAAVAGAYLVVTGGQIAGFDIFDAPVALLAFAAAGGAAVLSLRYI